MSIKVECDCGKTAKVKSELAGRKIKCPSCGAVIKVPGDDGPTEEPVKTSKRVKAVSGRLTVDKSLLGEQSTGVSTRLGSFDSQKLAKQDLKQSAIQDVVYVQSADERCHGDLVFSANSVYYVQLGNGPLPHGGAKNRPPGLQPKELTTKFPGSFKVKKKYISEFRVSENGKLTLWSEKGRYAWYVAMKYKTIIEAHLAAGDTGGGDDD